MDSRSRRAAEARLTRLDVELPGFGAGWRAWLAHNTVGAWCGYVRLDRRRRRRRRRRGDEGLPAGVNRRPLFTGR